MNQAERARSLLKDDLFVGVVNKQRQMYISNILDSRDEDVDLRERERLKLKGLDEFIASLESMASQTEIDKKRWKIF